MGPSNPSPIARLQPSHAGLPPRPAITERCRHHPARRACPSPTGGGRRAVKQQVEPLGRGKRRHWRRGLCASYCKDGGRETMKRLRSRLENPASTRLFSAFRALRPPSLHKEHPDPPAPPRPRRAPTQPAIRRQNPRRQPIPAPLRCLTARAASPRDSNAPKPGSHIPFSRRPIIAYRGATAARARLRVGAPRGPEKIEWAAPPRQSQEPPSPRRGHRRMNVGNRPGYTTGVKRPRVPSNTTRSTQGLCHRRFGSPRPGTFYLLPHGYPR